MKRLLTYLIAGLFFGISAMDVPPLLNPGTVRIQLQGTDPLRKNQGFISFEKAKIDAYKNHVLQEIRKTTVTQTDIYTIETALKIIEDSYQAFGGKEIQDPVPGYLEILKNLETTLSETSNIHGLAGRLCELERALDLTKKGYNIIEFGATITLPNEVRNAINTRPETYLIMDIDIYAQSPSGELIIEEVKSYKLCSDQTRKELCGIINGMKILKKGGIPCRMYTKYRLPDEVRELGQNCGVELICSDAGEMRPPTTKPPFQKNKNPDLIEPTTIQINIPKTCIVRYQKIEGHKKELTHKLEIAHREYIKSQVAQPDGPATVRPFIEYLFKSKHLFGGKTSGLLSNILVPLAIRVQERNWSMFKNTMFELASALDAPQGKKVIAFGAELFYDQANPHGPRTAPKFKAINGEYFIQKGAYTGYDLDVLLQDANNPDHYSFIEATTGPSSVKGFEKFQSMGRALGADVYILHDFNNSLFTRTAFWKNPVQILYPHTGTTHALPWELACRTQACLEEIISGKKIYKPLSINIGEQQCNELSHEFNTIYNRLKDAYYNPSGPSVWSRQEITERNAAYVFDDLNENITEIFKIIDEIDKKSRPLEAVYAKQIQRGLIKLMDKEKETHHVGSVAFAVLFLAHLNCTIPDQNLQQRYLTANSRYSFDVNGVLKHALDLAVQAIDSGQLSAYTQNI